jgi:hypothetical protein
MKGEEMETGKCTLDKSIPLRISLLLTLLADVYGSSQVAGKVNFEYVTAIDSKDSQFTNTADINGDGKPDILAFKGGGGFIG